VTTPPPQGQNPYAQGQQPYGQGQQPYGQAPGQAPYPPQGGFPQQQGYPQAPGQPGFPQQAAAPYSPLPPQPPKRKVSFKTIRTIILILVVAALAIGGWLASRDDADTASGGDCMHRGSTSDTNPDLEVVDCSSSKAQYIVLAKIDGSFTSTTADSKCAAEASDYQYAYTETGDGSNFLLCLKDYAK
jgi:hypothetical protein